MPSDPHLSPTPHQMPPTDRDRPRPCACTLRCHGAPATPRPAPAADLGICPPASAAAESYFRSATGLGSLKAKGLLPHHRNARCNGTFPRIPRAQQANGRVLVCRAAPLPPPHSEEGHPRQRTSVRARCATRQAKRHAWCQ
jgi:hypothetical protein